MSTTPSSRRGRTAAGRLRALDQYVITCERELLLRGRGPFLDVGFGDEPATTLASAEAFRELAPGMEVIGVERDPQRVASAAGCGLRIVTGDFSTLPSLGPARLIRVMNVLRGYREEEVAPAHAQLGAALEEEGLAMEGSANPSGGLLTAHLLRRRGGTLRREGLLFFTAFEEGFAPAQFRDWLPRDLRRRVRPGEAIHAFLSDWTAAWEETRAPHREDPSAAFSAAASALAARRQDVASFAPGYLLWRPAGGVPRGNER